MLNMDVRKMRSLLEDRLQKEKRTFHFDREKDTLRIENNETGKGVTISLPNIISKWQNQKEKALDEVIYYVDNALGIMGKVYSLSGQEHSIYPVIRSTSFPTTASDDEQFVTDDHTAETRIFYALDLGNSYQLIDEKLLNKEGWDKQKIRETALFNLRSLSTTVKEDHVAGNRFYFLHTNDGYDASRILNDSFLKKMSLKTNGQMTVSVPHQDVFIIGDIENNAGYDVLAQMTLQFFADGKVPITALSFIYDAGSLEPIFIMGKNRRQ